MSYVAADASPAASGNRLRQLDALRGLAALFVVFNHYSQIVPDRIRLADTMASLHTLHAWLSPWPWLRFTPFRLLVNGGAAVDLFFVLSGFVLALPLTPGRQPKYWPFLVKRICRVYLPFAVVILLVAIAYSVLPVAPSPTVNRSLVGLRVSPAGYSLAGHLLMLGGPTDMSLDTVIWTLIHEVRLSPLLPLIFLSIRRAGAIQTVAVCLLISILASFGMTNSISGSWHATLHVLWMFAAGSALSYHRNYLSGLVKNFSFRLTAALWVGAIALLIAPFDRVWSDFATAVGAGLLILLCLPDSRVTSALTSPVPLWLGRVSYSLYLIHLPILVLAVSGGCPASWTIIIFVLTLLAAELAYRGIEAPAHRLGVYLAQRGWGTLSPQNVPPPTLSSADKA